jgi:hypothetical protein
MRKRIRLETGKLTLKTTKVELRNLKEKANNHPKGRGARAVGAIVAIDKDLLGRLIADYEALARSLKKHGGFFERVLHYSETESWKDSIGKPIKDKDVPAFLRKEKPKL